MKRFNSYMNNTIKNQCQPKLYNSLKKYGPENHQFTVIEECELEELNVKERYWQDYFDATGRSGLNCTLTSVDETPCIVSDETRKKMSEAGKIRMKRLMKDPVFLAKMKEVYKKQKGRKMPPRSEAYRQYRREEEIKKGNWKGSKNPWFGVDRSGENNTMYGKNQSESTKDKIRAKAIGRLHNDRSKIKMSESRSMGGNVKAKIVFNYENGVFFECGKEAWESTSMKIAFSTFRCQLNGWNKNKTSFKYV